ncbi:MAG: hypothetical protein KF774_21040 [Planctomyces sp.]|nr:hypothetical protein [Planctomyces sp.]
MFSASELLQKTFQSSGTSLIIAIVDAEAYSAGYGILAPTERSVRKRFRGQV